MKTWKGRVIKPSRITRRAPVAVGKERLCCRIKAIISCRHEGCKWRICNDCYQVLRRHDTELFDMRGNLLIDDHHFFSEKCSILFEGSEIGWIS